MCYITRIVIWIIIALVFAFAFYVQDKSFGYDHPQLIDHVHHLQTLVDVDPSFKERVRSCWDYTQWRPHFDNTVYPELDKLGKDTNFGFGLLCNDGSYIGAFIIDSEYPTYYHYNAEETLLLPSIS